MKSILSTVLFCLIFSVVHTQVTSVEMNVPYRSQKTENWCWAASMKMIMDFHNPLDSNSYDQCDLAAELSRFNLPVATRKFIDQFDCCIGCGDDCLGYAGNNPNLKKVQKNLIKTIKFTYDSMPTIAVADNYDLVYSKFGYSSNQVLNRVNSPLRWQQITKHIEECRPFIINIDPTPTQVGELDANHALVVSGYKQIINGTDTSRYVIANDPWTACSGSASKALFPIDIFERIDTVGVTTIEAGIYLVNRVYSTVHTIQIDTLSDDPSISDCISCDFLNETYPGENSFQTREEEPVEVELVEDTSLAIINLSAPRDPSQFNKEFNKILNSNARNIVGYRSPTLSDEEFNKFLSDPKYVNAPVEYISSRFVNRRGFWYCLFPPRKLSKVKMEGYKVYDVVSPVAGQQLTTTMQQRLDGTWTNRRIANYTNLDQVIDVQIDNREQRVSLNNVEGIQTSNTKSNYTLIKYVPFQYEFYSFEQGGKQYMAPANDYPNLGLKQNIGYKEKKVVKSLRKNTLDYEKLVTTLFDTRSVYNQFAQTERINYNKNVFVALSNNN